MKIALEIDFLKSFARNKTDVILHKINDCIQRISLIFGIDFEISYEYSLEMLFIKKKICIQILN